jgi:tungstate transport system ATP-binding protein
MKDSTLLSIRDLKIVLGGQSIVDLPNLDVHRGEVLVILGPNGAGKSTLLLAIAHLLKPSQGTISLTEYPHLPDLSYRRLVATVFQSPLLMDDTVYQNVAAGLHFRGVPERSIRERVDQWLDRLHIQHLEKRRAKSLSGGEAQRVSLARAFCLDTDLILLDEPFSALDAPTRQELLDELRGLLAETNRTCVYVTHDLDEALALADRVAIFFSGNLHQIDPPARVFGQPATHETAAFVGVETILPGIVVSQKDELVQVKSDGINLEAVSTFTIGTPVFACLRPEDITLLPATDTPGVSSARNRLAGRITRLTSQGPLVRVQLETSFPVSALITRSSCTEMGLHEGMPVIGVFKTSAIHLIRRQAD